MQSTRYCNYSKDKFDNQITCIKPVDFKSDSYIAAVEDEAEFFRALLNAENHYMRLTTMFKWPAEKARKVLPLDVATVFIQCGFERDWDNFFNQRLFGTTGAPHPDAKYITEMIYEKYKASKQVL